MTPVSTPQEPPRPRSVRQNAGLAFATQMTTASLTAVLTIVLVRVLEPAEFGLFALAVSLGTLVLLPADFGISAASSRLIAEHRGSAEDVRTLFVDVVRLKLVVAGALCAVLFALAGPIADLYATEGLAWPIRLIAVAVLGQTMLLLLGTTAVGIGRVELHLRVVAVESVLEVAASLALVLAGAGAAGAAAGRAFGYVVGFGLGLLVFLRFLGRATARRPRGSVRQLGRRIAGYAGALLLVDGAFALLSQIDVLLVGAYLGAAAVGVFSAPTRLLTFLHYPGSAVASGIAPLYVRPATPTGERRRPDPAQLASGLRAVVLLQFALVVPTVVWAVPITDLLFGPGYEDSALVLAAFAPFTFLQAVGPLVSITLNYFGAARRRLPIALGALAIDASLGLVLIPSMGVVGGVIASDVGYAVYVGGHLWLCHRLLGLALRPLAAVATKGLVAAVGMAAVLAAFGTRSLGPIDWVAGGALGLAAYVVLLLATRAVSPDELRVARGAVARRFGR
jgi:O-antigen/teichoic acid export membrane protein